MFFPAASSVSKKSRRTNFMASIASILYHPQVSRVNELVEIREAGIILELVSEWTPWSPCENCVGKRGTKTSRAQCRVKRQHSTQVKFHFIFTKPSYINAVQKYRTLKAREIPNCRDFSFR